MLIDHDSSELFLPSAVATQREVSSCRLPLSSSLRLPSISPRISGYACLDRAVCVIDSNSKASAHVLPPKLSYQSAPQCSRSSEGLTLQGRHGSSAWIT